MKGSDNMKNLKWFVLVRDMNTDKIVPYNIFNNWWVYKDTEILLAHDTPRESFIKQLDLTLQYAFRSRFEYEIFTGDPFTEKVTDKINVYDQLKNNVEQLVDYIFENAKE